MNDTTVADTTVADTTVADPAAVTLENWAEPQHNRWSFQHLDQVIATTPVAAGTDPLPLPVDLPADDLLDLAAPRHDAAGRIERYTPARDVLDSTWTDGFIVLHNGRIVAETYSGQMQPQTRHLLMSVTKSVVGVVASVLIEDGRLAPTAKIEEIIPALADSGFAEATVRDLLDMRTGVRFNETYHDPDADVYLMEHAVGWREQREDVPATMHEFLATLGRDERHGGRFRYRSSDTNVLGWVCEVAGGAPLADLIADLVWRPMGAEHSAHITVDPAGHAVADGGLSATLRDVARFAELLRCNGFARGRQVTPAWFVSDTLLGAPTSKDAFAATDSPTGMPGGHYRNQIWVPFRYRNVLLGLGIHGQMVYVNQRAGVVGVKLSSWPTAQDAVAFYDTLGAFEALARELSTQPEPPTSEPPTPMP